MAKITSLIISLLIVLGLIGIIFSMNTTEMYSETSQEKSPQTQVVSSISLGNEEIEVSQKDSLVTDKVVNNYDKDSQVVVISKDGSKRIIKGGTILVDENVVSQEGESSSVYNLDTQRTVSSE